MWTIRPIRSTDAAFAEEVFFHGPYNQGEPPPARTIMQDPLMRIYLDGFGRPTDFGFIADGPASRRSVGCVYARYFDDRAHGLGYKNSAVPELSIAVMPEFRGRGCGSALMRSMCAHCDANEIDLSLNCHPGNPAHRLYERMGFQVIAPRANGDLMFRGHEARQ
jgi:GNAT superfamily N-acetyltransferase